MTDVRRHYSLLVPAITTIVLLAAGIGSAQAQCAFDRPTPTS